MGKLRGFMEYDRTDESYVPVTKRIKNYDEFTIKPSDKELEKQGGRCMDCGVPFCHSGCPLGNLIPDFNDAVYNKKWKHALEIYYIQQITFLNLLVDYVLHHVKRHVF